MAVFSFFLALPGPVAIFAFIAVFCVSYADSITLLRECCALLYVSNEAFSYKFTMACKMSGIFTPTMCFTYNTICAVMLRSDVCRYVRSRCMPTRLADDDYMVAFE